MEGEDYIFDSVGEIFRLWGGGTGGRCDIVDEFKNTIVWVIVLSQTDIFFYPSEMIRETFGRWGASNVSDDHKHFCIINYV